MVKSEGDREVYVGVTGLCLAALKTPPSSCPAEAGRRSQSDAPSSELLESRRELFSYLLTLMRSAHAEHAGLLPAIDVAAQEHLAWVLDALFYLLQVCASHMTCTASHVTLVIGHVTRVVGHVTHVVGYVTLVSGHMLPVTRPCELATYMTRAVTGHMNRLCIFASC